VRGALDGGDATGSFAAHRRPSSTSKSRSHTALTPASTSRQQSRFRVAATPRAAQTEGLNDPDVKNEPTTPESGSAAHQCALERIRASGRGRAPASPTRSEPFLCDSQFDGWSHFRFGRRGRLLAARVLPVEQATATSRCPAARLGKAELSAGDSAALSPFPKHDSEAIRGIDARSDRRTAVRVLTGRLAPGPPSKRSGRRGRAARSHQTRPRGPRRSPGR